LDPERGDKKIRRGEGRAQRRRPFKEKTVLWIERLERGSLGGEIIPK